MKVIRLNNWFIKDNCLSISMARYSVIINIKNEDFLLYKLEVILERQEILAFNFSTLEDAIEFTENVVAKAQNKEEIVNAYLMLLKERKKLIRK